MTANHDEKCCAWRDWLIIVLFSAAIIGWGVLNYVLIRDEPRHWDFGVLPSTPSESIYSTAPTPAPSSVPPQQIEPLPEAQPTKTDPGVSR